MLKHLKVQSKLQIESIGPKIQCTKFITTIFCFSLKFEMCAYVYMVNLYNTVHSLHSYIHIYLYIVHLNNTHMTQNVAFEDFRFDEP